LQYPPGFAASVVEESTMAFRPLQCADEHIPKDMLVSTYDMKDFVF